MSAQFDPKPSHAQLILLVCTAACALSCSAEDGPKEMSRLVPESASFAAITSSPSQSADSQAQVALPVAGSPTAVESKPQPRPQEGGAAGMATQVVSPGCLAGSFAPPPPFPGSAGAPATVDIATCAELPAELGERWIAFDAIREGFNRDLYLVRANGKDLKRLTDAPNTEREPTFSPDGERLAFSADSSGKFQIYIRNLESGETVQLTKRAEGADQPSWSADGKRLVFHSGSAVFIIDATGDNERELARGDDTFNTYKYPALTPNGLEVVFDRNNEIDALRLDDKTQRYVVQNWTTTEESPAISPDGVNVAYSVVCGSEARIGVVPLAGYAANPCSVLFATPLGSGAARRPAWGSDGVLAYERGNPQDVTGVSIAITRGLEGKPCDVLPAGANHNPNWAPASFKGL